MSCVTIVHYSVRLKNAPLSYFKPTQKLRQVDPLSPYLFLLVSDGLSKLLQTEIQGHNLQELNICRRAPGVFHLVFTDDTLLFFIASEDQAATILQVLKTFERGTGQLIKPLKCSMIFGNKCTTQDREKVLYMLNVANSVGESKYLGLRTPEGRMNKEKFKTTKERLVKRCSNWTEKHMSSAAKEVLIKSVAQVTPTYTMGVFKLPATTCDELTQIIRKFWWGEENGTRKVHWIAWDKLLAPKGKGGMEFRDMRLFNKALLARQAWRLIQFPNSLCARLLKAKYYPIGTW
jgi:hypothetical protein